ncbi:hypothetical protein, partial [Streptomyces sp. SM12]|uniref:hypothetical protein n=1 Tax=Streptomyces sp. SM12 TaxID=1071602 RepID=UPI001CA53E81
HAGSGSVDVAVQHLAADGLKGRRQGQARSARFKQPGPPRFGLAGFSLFSVECSTVKVNSCVTAFR